MMCIWKYMLVEIIFIMFYFKTCTKLSKNIHQFKGRYEVVLCHASHDTLKMAQTNFYFPNFYQISKIKHANFTQSCIQNYMQFFKNYMQFSIISKLFQQGFFELINVEPAIGQQ